MLIDLSYFIAGPRQIQNATLGKGTTKEGCLIMQYIEEYQYEFLEAVLGTQVAMRVHDYLLRQDKEGDIEPDRQVDSVCGKLRKAFADYVFFSILRDCNDQATVTGIVRIKGGNEFVSPLNRQVTVWNRMVDHLNIFAEWVDSHECPMDGVVIDDNMLTPINRFNL